MTFASASIVTRAGGHCPGMTRSRYRLDAAGSSSAGVKVHRWSSSSSAPKIVFGSMGSTYRNGAPVPIHSSPFNRSDNPDQKAAFSGGPSSPMGACPNNTAASASPLSIDSRYILATKSRSSSSREGQSSNTSRFTSSLPVTRLIPTYSTLPSTNAQFSGRASSSSSSSSVIKSYGSPSSSAPPARAASGPTYSSQNSNASPGSGQAFHSDVPTTK
mmetsp:Transcript_29337/g.86948  ORF Transcript_29337/g.86948 Transcript_29337/m.86948 type:complete len:216 (-) Transcript_29337:650-1297(-)